MQFKMDGYCRLTLLFASVLVLTSCNENKFDRGNGMVAVGQDQNQENISPASSNDLNRNSELEPREAHASEEALGTVESIAIVDTQKVTTVSKEAVPPVPVAGAYLTCRMDHKAATPNTAAVECNIPDKDELNSRAAKFDFAFGQVEKPKDKPLPIMPLSSLMSYDQAKAIRNWTFTFNRSEFKSPLLVVEVRDDFSKPGEAPKYRFVLDLKEYFPILLLGDSFLRFGSGAAVLSGCSSKAMAKAVETNVYRKTFKVLSASASFKLKLLGICGINAYGIENSTVKIEQLTSDIGSGAQDLPSKLSANIMTSGDMALNGTLAKGTYQITISSGFYNRFFGDDDFIINQIEFIASMPETVSFDPM